MKKHLVSIAVALLLCAAGICARAEEAAHQILTAVSPTTLSGYVSTSAVWRPVNPSPAVYSLPGFAPYGRPVMGVVISTIINGRLETQVLVFHAGQDPRPYLYAALANNRAVFLGLASFGRL